MTESAWIIPDDWSLDTGEWQSICVQWPKSEQFDLLFRSLLFTLTRGREWDRGSGIIKDAQAIGWQIFDRNHDNPDCSGVPCPECDNCQECTADVCRRLNRCRGGSVILMEDDMGQVVTDVTVDDGHLIIWFGPCCPKDLGAISDILSGGDDMGLGDDPLNPDNDPDKVYSACSKAVAVTSAIYAVLNSAYDAASTPEIWKWVGQVESDLGYNLSDKWVTALIIDWVAYGLVIDPDDVFSGSDRAKTICAMQNVFSNDALGVPDSATYEALKAAIHTQNFLYDGLIMTAVACLGKGNLDSIAKLGADDLDATCLCEGEIPAGETTPDANGWYLGANFADDIGYYIGTKSDAWYYTAGLTKDAYGLFIVLDVPPTAGQTKRMSPDDLLGGVPGLFPTPTVSITANTSDNLQDLNQTYPLFQFAGNAATKANLAAQRGYVGYNSLTASGVDSAVIASPELPYQTSAALVIYCEDETLTGYVKEIRFIHNTGSPHP